MFEVSDVFGKRIRTSEKYWSKIKEEKHTDLDYDVDAVINTLQKPDEVHESVKDSTIALYRRVFKENETVVVVVKHLNGN